ncbi:MFS transporter [Rhizohabitans arisaemae]|uniref:MFS transporter n=1 Tax=Rhizohabitans arisaemae TaxID=2720610 RepID=UPI0024B0E632|nr:MFS transporter [Rhizohabitans arisaemae]
MNHRSARRRYALVSFLTWFPVGLMLAPFVLIMTERGLDLAAIGLVFAIYSLVVVALELPTGGLADVLGRRVVLAASAVFTVAAMAWLAVAGTLTEFIAISVLKGVARALHSGPAQAWYVDTAHAVEGPDADLKPGLAAGSSAGSAGLGGGALLGGVIPLLVPAGWSAGPILPLSLPLLLASATAAVLLVTVVLALPEPPRAAVTLGGVLRGVPATIVSGFRTALGDGVLTRLLVVAVALGVVLNAVEMLTPGRLAQITGRPETAGLAYAVVAAVGFLGSSLGSAAAPAAARRTGTSARGAIAASLAGVLALAALAGTVPLAGAVALVFAGLAYLLLFAGAGVVDVLRSELMHGRVDSARRATLLSVDSLLLQVGGGLSALAFGWLASRYGTAASWWVTAGLLALSTFLYRQGRRAAEPSLAEVGRLEDPRPAG